MRNWRQGYNMENWMQLYPIIIVKKRYWICEKNVEKWETEKLKIRIPVEN